MGRQRMLECRRVLMCATKGKRARQSWHWQAPVEAKHDVFSDIGQEGFAIHLISRPCVQVKRTSKKISCRKVTRRMLA